MKGDDSSEKNSQEKLKETPENNASKEPNKVKSFIKINITDSSDNNDFENNDTELKKVESTNSKNEFEKDDKISNKEYKNQRKSKRTRKSNVIESKNSDELRIPKIKLNDSSYVSDHSLNPRKGETRETRVSFNFHINEYFEDDEDWACELLDYRRSVPPSDEYRRGRVVRSLLCCCYHGNHEC